MSSTTVAEFANELKKSTDTLLEQLRSAGVSKSAPTDSLTDADKQPLQAAVEKTREVAKGTDVAAIKSAIENLEAASHAFSKVLYDKGQAGGAGGTSPEGAGSEEGASAQKKPDDDVIEGEFEVKK